MLVGYALDFMALASWMPLDFLGILCNSNEKGDQSLSPLLAETSKEVLVELSMQGRLIGTLCILLIPQIKPKL